MSERPSFVPPEFEGDPSISFPSDNQETPQTQEETVPPLFEAEVIQDFFGHGLFEEKTYKEAHPLGEDAEDPSVRAKKSAVAKGIFQGLRSIPGFTWLMRGLLASSLLSMAGEPQSVNASTSSKESAQKMMDQEGEQTVRDQGVQYELRQLVFEDLKQDGRIFTERDAQFGPADFSIEEVSDYAERLRDLGAMFEYLHRGDAEIIEGYHDPQKRLENYATLAQIIGNEFKHTKLLWTFSQETADMAADILPHLPEQQAMELYTQLYEQLLDQVGIRTAYDMSTCLLSELDPGAPLAVYIEESGFADPSIESWFKKSPQNNAYFDQNTGRINFMRRLSSKEASTVYQAISKLESGSPLIVMIDSAPANGGDPMASSYYDSKSSHDLVRTPDGEFPYEETVRKKCAAWRNSWMADGSPIRLTSDGKNVEYQDLDGKWYLATGEDAIFFGEKPFKEKEHSWVYKAGTRFEDGIKELPLPFTVNDFLVEDEGGNPHMGTTWEKNDFGSKSIHVIDPRKGGRASFLYHSSPRDEGDADFLEYSHGCVHMKPEDVEKMDEYLTKGSIIRNSSLPKDQCILARL